MVLVQEMVVVVGATTTTTSTTMTMTVAMKMTMTTTTMMTVAVTMAMNNMIVMTTYHCDNTCYGRYSYDDGVILYVVHQFIVATLKPWTNNCILVSVNHSY